MLILPLFLGLGIHGTPILDFNDGPEKPPCVMQEDAPGPISGPSVKSGTIECMFQLEDPAHSDGLVPLALEFRKSRYMPLDEDIDTPRKMIKLEPTDSGANHRASLRLGGTFTSYSKPYYDDEAEVWLMPRWRDAAAQDAAVPGADWQPVSDVPHVRCNAEKSRCRLIARDDNGLFAVIFFPPKRNEALGVTATAVKAVVANW